MYNGLYEYLEQCPQLKNQSFNFDYIDGDPVGYTLAIPPNTPELEKYTNGDSKQKLDFYLIGRQFYGNDRTMNMNNLELFRKVKAWFIKQNNKDIFPDLGPDKVVQGVYATTEGYVDQTSEGSAQYQIQCRVEYVQLSMHARKAPMNF